MAEDLQLPAMAGKVEMYDALLPQIKSLTEGEGDPVANMANIAAALREAFGWWWVGFYRVVDRELVLGPFQGPVACTRIAFGRGVCGTAWKSAQSLLVPDVNAFPGHIACSSASTSEIVVPVFDKDRQVIAVLDVDSERTDVLDQVDVTYLEKIAALITSVG